MVQFSEVRREAKVIKLMVPGIVGDPIQTYQMKTRWSMFPGGPKSKIASKLTTGDRIIRYGHERRMSIADSLATRRTGWKFSRNEGSKTP